MKIFNKGRKFKIVTIAIVFTLLTTLIIVIVIKNNNKVLLEQTLKSEIQSVSNHLNELDNNVLENQDKVKEVIVSDKDNFIAMKEKISLLQDSINLCKSQFNDYTEMFADSNSNITSNFLLVKSQIDDSYKKIDQVELNIISVANSQNSELHKKLSELDESIDLTLKSIKKTKNDILNLLELLKNDSDGKYQELNTLLNTVHQKISLDIEKSLFEIDNMFNTLATDIQIKLNNLHLEIQQAQNNITDILHNMEVKSTENHVEIIDQFDIVKKSIVKINTDLNSIYQDIRALILHLEKQGKVNHADTIAVLSSVESSIQDDLQNKLLQINESFTTLSSNIDIQFNFLSSTLEQAFTHTDLQVKNEFSALQNKFDQQNQQNKIYFDEKSNEINQSVMLTNKNAQDAFSILKVFLVDQDESLIDFLTGKSNELDQKLNSLFQSVSSGKSNLASALLTKGITINEDASFYDFQQAILNIKQKLLIGVEQLPGEISYDYHYHEDNNGNQPHIDTQLQKGGCYTIAIYHSHISNCYSTRSCGGRAERRTYMTQGCNCGPQLGGGTRCGTHGCTFRPPSAQYPSGSADCRCPKSTDWFCTVCGSKTGGDTCSQQQKVLTCPKNGSTIDLYRTGCKLNDGQIIAAHIVYSSKNPLDKTNDKGILPDYVPPVIKNDSYVFVPEELESNIHDEESETSNEEELENGIHDEKNEASNEEGLENGIHDEESEVSNEEELENGIHDEENEASNEEGLENSIHNEESKTFNESEKTEHPVIFENIVISSINKEIDYHKVQDISAESLKT